MKNITRNAFALGLMSLLSLSVTSQGAFAAQTANSTNSKPKTTAHSVHGTAKHSSKKKYPQHTKKMTGNTQSAKPATSKDSTTKGSSAANVTSPNK